MDSKSGPYLIAALFCERVIEEKDGVLSAVRIIDTITAALEGPDAPEEMPPVPVNLTALIMFRAGEARGRYKLGLRIEEPSGIQVEVGQESVNFDGSDRGENRIFNLNLVLAHEGLYWFDVLLEGELVTRTPLRVKYQVSRRGRAS